MKTRRIGYTRQSSAVNFILVDKRRTARKMMRDKNANHMRGDRKILKDGSKTVGWQHSPAAQCMLQPFE